MEKHFNGKLVRWNANLKQKPHKLVGMAYQGDEDEMEGVQMHMCLRPILPMYVAMSPIYVALTHTNNEQWKSRYTDSMVMIVKLQSLIRCYVLIEVLPKKRRDAVWAMFKQQTDELEESFYAKALQLKSASLLKKLIQRHTWDYIHLLEGCLHKLFAVPLKWDECVSPEWDPGSIEKQFDQNGKFVQEFKRRRALFFQKKEKAAGRKGVFEFKRSVCEEYLTFFTS